MDYQSTLYDPIYLSIGVCVTLELPDSGSEFPMLTALDKTAGVDVGDKGAAVQTIKPAACLRVAELTAAGITLDELPGALLTMNGGVWNVISFRRRPSPNGENDGEVLLILSGRVPLDDVSESE